MSPVTTWPTGLYMNGKLGHVRSIKKFVDHCLLFSPFTFGLLLSIFFRFTSSILLKNVIKYKQKKLKIKIKKTINVHVLCIHIIADR